MTLTPALALLGIALIVFAIPFAFSIGPFVIGAIVLVYAGRRGHRALAFPETPAVA